LSQAHFDYAVSDVTHLRTVYLKLKADLERTGRTEWVQEEMSVLTSRDTYAQEPEHAWQRLRTRVRRPRELAVLMEVAAWREREAQARDLPRQRVLKDDALAEIAQQQPKTEDELGRLRALPKGYERSRSGEAILAAVAAGLQRDPKSLPRLARSKGLSNGASATVELLKVLLRMTSERHGVAAKVIATVDDLERIAADEDADVPALKGWRREMFGNEALKLKRGAVALAVESGRVVTIDRAPS
jgi:ribonuclease D